MYAEYRENNEDEKAIESMDEYKERFDSLDRVHKGSWAELATTQEADREGQIILVEHPENPHKHGFDCVSIDPETSRLHLWEAKNYGENTNLSVSKLTAWKDTENGEFREGFLRNTREVIDSVPDGPVRETVRRSIHEGNVTYHLRVGPETNINPNLADDIREYLPQGSDFDIKKYSTDYMNRFYDTASVNESTHQHENASEDTKDTSLEQSEWINRGIIEVPIKSVDISDTAVADSTDFHKVSRDQMINGFEKLENEIRPAVKEGAIADDFSQLDKKLGLDYEHGYRRVYDAFYGNEPVRLEKDGEKYSVVNGYHRLYVAKELGIESIPASVIERIKRM